MNGLEQYYELASDLYAIVSALIVAYCYVVWVRDFLTDRAKAWMIGAVYVVLMLFLDFMPFYINGMLAHSIGVLAALPVMLWIDREYAAQKLFLAVTFFCLRWQTWRIVISIGNELDGWRYMIYVNKDAMFWFRKYVIGLVADDLLAFLLLYGGVRCLLWAYGCGRERMDIREFLLVGMPALSGVVAYGMLRTYDYVYERDTGHSIYALYGSLDLTRICYSLSYFAAILVSVYVFRRWKNEQEEDRRREVFSRQMQDLENHISEVEMLYRDMRRMRHDMGNHIMTLERLYDGGEYEAAGKYAGALKEEIANVASDVSSGNPVTDVILSCRKKEMEEKGIDFECEFFYPKSGNINAFDVSIVLNNALSNAIEAIERERAQVKECSAEYDNNVTNRNISSVSLKSSCVKNMYMIEVSNGYAGEWKMDAQSGLPLTSKPGEGHGFGLSNIRHVARRYLGDIEIGKEVYEGEERCVLRVMMQLTTDKSSSTTSHLILG